VESEPLHRLQTEFHGAEPGSATSSGSEVVMPSGLHQTAGQ